MFRFTLSLYLFLLLLVVTLLLFSFLLYVLFSFLLVTLCNGWCTVSRSVGPPMCRQLLDGLPKNVTDIYETCN